MCTCPTGRMRDSKNVSHRKNERLTKCVPWGDRNLQNVSHGENEKLTECVPWGEWELTECVPWGEWDSQNVSHGRMRDSQNVSHGENERLTECVPWGEWETHRMCPMRRMRDSQNVSHGETETHRMCPMGRARDCALRSKSCHWILVELCTLYLLTCQVRVTVGDSGLCCCYVCVASFECQLTPMCVDSSITKELRNELTMSGTCSPGSRYWHRGRVGGPWHSSILPHSTRSLTAFTTLCT